MYTKFYELQDCLFARSSFQIVQSCSRWTPTEEPLARLGLQQCRARPEGVGEWAQAVLMVLCVCLDLPKPWTILPEIGQQTG